MTDSRSGYDEGQLPWLEEVEDEDGPRGVSAGRMLGALLVVLLAAAIVAGAFFWLGRQDPAESGGAPELIRAPEGPYKVKPSDPGGLDVAGESETAFETSAGQDVDSQLDTSRMPQQQPAAPAEPKPDEPVAAEPPTPPAPSGASGSVVQLGAFKNTAQAERAWSALTARFPDLGGLSKIVVPYSAGGSSGYRLRAGAGSPTEAQQICRALEAGGESCFIAR
ncbi:MAG: SPOR domain-containing protein [Pseudomonadota bacterium]|nr:SPOR domain-containing protein [Pseudomonadota bacterium]